MGAIVYNRPFIQKRISRDDFVMYVYGPVVVGEYHFHINHEISNALKVELFNSITTGGKLRPMRTMKVAQEMASFAVSQLLQFAMRKDHNPETVKYEWFALLQSLPEKINKRMEELKLK